MAQSIEPVNKYRVVNVSVMTVLVQQLDSPHAASDTPRLITVLPFVSLYGGSRVLSSYTCNPIVLFNGMASRFM